MAMVTFLFENGTSMDVHAPTVVANRILAQFGKRLEGEADVQSVYRYDDDSGEEVRLTIDLKKVLAVVTKTGPL